MTIFVTGNAIVPHPNLFLVLLTICAEVVTYIINKISFYRIPIVNVLSEKEQRTCGRNKRSTPIDNFKNDEDRHIDTHEMKVELGRPTNVANNNSEIEINIIPPKGYVNSTDIFGIAYKNDI